MFSTRIKNFFAISIKFKIVVCKLFQFGTVQNKLFGKGLKNPLHRGFCKPNGTRKKYWKPAFSFQTRFSIVCRKIQSFQPNFMSSANALNLDQSNIMSFVKDLTLYHTILTFNKSMEEAF